MSANRVFVGGISFFSQSRGWSCDSIISYEIVLPNGRIAQVDQDNDPELFWALHGAGSSNFGIVTSFMVEAIELPNPKGLWLESRIYTQDKVPKLLDHLQQVWTNDDRDLLAMNFYAFNGTQNTFAFVVSRVHTTHTNPTTLPKSIPSAHPIKSIPSTAKSEILSVGGVTATVTQGTRGGKCNMWLSFTYRPSRDFEAALYAIFEEEVVKLKGVESFNAKLTTQLLPRTTTSNNRNGGFLASASSDDNKPLVLANFGWSCKLVSDEQKVQETAIRCLERVEARAKEMHAWHPFKYMNYADENIQEKQVWDGFGEENVLRLKKIQKRVDPTGMFTRGGLASGYFKLNTFKGCSL